MGTFQQLEPALGMSRRKPWLIVTLGLLFSSFVFVYCGRLRRGLAWLAGMWLCVMPLSVVLMLYVSNGKVAVYGGCFVLVLFVVVQILDALSVGKQQQGKPHQSYQSWWGYLGLVLLFAVFNNVGLEGLKVYWVEAYVLPTQGMQNTLLSGDRFLVDKWVDKHALARGQVVVFRSPDDSRFILVQRLIALPGDTVRIEDDEVYVNGELLHEPYAVFQEPSPPLPAIHQQPRQQVPEDSFFVLGDNRWWSHDSRNFGFVPLDNFIGSAKIVFWSQEYEQTMPTREHPAGQESWGKMRWQRIGTRVR